MWRSSDDTKSMWNVIVEIEIEMRDTIYMNHKLFEVLQEENEMFDMTALLLKKTFFHKHVSNLGKGHTHTTDKVNKSTVVNRDLQ